MKLNKNIRDKMRGLLPFDGDSVEYYTPKEYKKVIEKDKEGNEIECPIPEEFQPVFHLKPWNQEQKEKVEIIIEKLSSEKTKNEDKIKVNKEIGELCRSQVVNIEKLYDVGKNDFIDVEIEDGCISKKDWSKIPQKIQTSVYFCLISISGLLSSEIVGL